jgi:hypothetical protein
MQTAMQLLMQTLETEMPETLQTLETQMLETQMATRMERRLLARQRGPTRRRTEPVDVS